jgi:hypothetical protein
MSTKPSIRDVPMPELRRRREERDEALEAAAMLHTIEGVLASIASEGARAPVVYRLPGGQIGFGDGWPIEPWAEQGPWLTRPGGPQGSA